MQLRFASFPLLMAVLILTISVPQGNAFVVQPKTWADAGVVSTATTRRGSAFTVLSLHPNQAADLEACAYTLMKEAALIANEQSQKDAIMGVRRQQQATASCDNGTGPLAWCRRVLQKTLHLKQQESTRM